MKNSGLEKNHFENPRAFSEIPVNLPCLDKFLLHWAAVTPTGAHGKSKRFACPTYNGSTVVKKGSFLLRTFRKRV